MVQLLDYGNAIFWIGILLAIFLAVCDFLGNDMNITMPLNEHKRLTFPKHPLLQRASRTAFLVLLILALFAKFGTNWAEHPHSFAYDFCRIMCVLIIYHIVCYNLIILIMGGLKIISDMISWLWHSAVNTIKHP